MKQMPNKGEENRLDWMKSPFWEYVIKRDLESGRMEHAEQVGLEVQKVSNGRIYDNCDWYYGILSL